MASSSCSSVASWSADRWHFRAKQELRFAIAESGRQHIPAANSSRHAIYEAVKPMLHIARDDTKNSTSALVPTAEAAQPEPRGAREDPKRRGKGITFAGAFCMGKCFVRARQDLHDERLTASWQIRRYSAAVRCQLKPDKNR